MAELAALFTLISLSLLAVRVGTVALQKTGLSREVSAFQAQSAFMGVGFTTAEAEAVVGHPVRRRIVRTLMLLGFGAITSTLGTIVLTFAQEGGGLDAGTKVLVLISFVLVLAVIVHVPAFDRLVDRIIATALETMTKPAAFDLHELLQLDKGYRVATVIVGEGTWLEDQTLRHLALADEGVLVLSVQRGDTKVVIGTPAARTRLHGGDHVLLYGLESDLADLHHRPTGQAGDQLHAAAVARQRLRKVGERSEDEAAEAQAAGEDA